MKITKTQLRMMIQESVESALSERIQPSSLKDYMWLANALDALKTELIHQAKHPDSEYDHTDDEHIRSTTAKKLMMLANEFYKRNGMWGK